MHLILAWRDDIALWYWQAFHVALHTVTSHFVVSQLVELAHVMILAAAIVAPLMVYPRTRRVIMATVKFTVRHVPARYRWVLLITRIPTPFEIDDIIAFAILAYPIFKSARNRRTLARIIRNQWQGR